MADRGNIEYVTSTKTVLILFFILVVLLLLLFFLYKTLNKEANGEYTIRRIVYKEGGVRDRVRSAALALETCSGIQLWPRSETGEDGEEMWEVQDKEGHVEEGSRQEDSDSDGDEEEEEEEERCGKGEGKGDTSVDDSSLEGAVTGEETRLIDETEAEGCKEDKEEKVGDGDVKGEASGGAGLLIDLKQFSGSAIWSEEEGRDGDVTAL